jgi:hypothetical protein
MTVPLDETCPPALVVTDERQTTLVVTTEERQSVSVVDDGGTITNVTPAFTNEDCPGARTGAGCE